MAQDGVIQVNFASLEAGAQSLAGAGSNLERQISDLQAAMAPMLATWDGSAMEAYLPRKESWKTAATEVQTHIMTLKRAVDEANQLYTANESANANMLGA